MHIAYRAPRNIRSYRYERYSARACSRRMLEHGAALSRLRCARSRHEIAESSATLARPEPFAFCASRKWVGTKPRRGSRGFGQRR
jgi:hypothetical protein